METWEILKDAEESQHYLNETGDTTTAHARRCLNLIMNVEYLFKENPLWNNDMEANL